MTIRDVIARVDTFDEEDTIFAVEPWTADSVALVLPEPADPKETPREALEAGASYLLEVFIALEVLDAMPRVLRREPTLEERVQRVIDYSINDA